MANEGRQPDRGRQILFHLYILTSVIHLPALFLYESSRRLGLLPGRYEWTSQGNWYGPWANSWEGLVVNGSLMLAMVLPLVTLSLVPKAYRLSPSRPHLTYFASLGLFVFQCCAFVFLTRQTGWSARID